MGSAVNQTELVWSEKKGDEHQRDVLVRCRSLWLEGYSAQYILDETRIPIHVFAKKRRIWDAIKAKYDDIILRKIRERTLEESAQSFVEKGLYVGNYILDRLIARKDELHAKDFKLIMDAITSIHRVKQLEAGEPTDITKRTEGMSPDQVMELVIKAHETLREKHGAILDAADEIETVAAKKTLDVH